VVYQNSIARSRPSPREVSLRRAAEGAATDFAIGSLATGRWCAADSPRERDRGRRPLSPRFPDRAKEAASGGRVEVQRVAAPALSSCLQSPIGSEGPDATGVWPPPVGAGAPDGVVVLGPP
jgi:hypothetical protein